MVRVQVAPAHARADDADHCIAGLPQGRVGNVDDTDVARAEQVGSSHDRQSTPIGGRRGVPVVAGTGSASLPPARSAYRRRMATDDGIDLRSQIRDFLSTRRARLSPDQAGLPAYGGNRRVKGLRREEVAMLAGVSVDYYVRMERGSLGGASESVLDALADALRLDEAERTHLFALARASGEHGTRRRKVTPATVRPAIQQVLDAITDAPAWIRNARHDILAMNQLARALYAPVLADPRRPANTTRFVYLDPAAEEFFVDHARIAKDAAAMLRLEAGRNPHDKALIELIGELSTRSDLFRRRWASHDVKFHRSGQKRLRHPVVGQLDLDFESLELASEPGYVLNVYTAAADTPTADGLKLLASWAASQEQLGTENVAARSD
jgi:transcriptional regulator with XRE-family HTH domain